jgi:hypothetical protein
VEIIVKTKVLGILRIMLDVAGLTETTLEELCTAILATAPQGTLYASSPPIQAGVAQLKAAQANYKTASAQVVTLDKQLVTAKQAEADLRVALLTVLVQLKGLVETTAKTEADVKGTGYTPLGKVPRTAAVAAPTGVDIFYPKKGHGRAKVSAQETGARRRYNAQICVGPTAQGPWTDLDGDGKSHWLTFPPGTVLWVHYRTLRGHQKSDFCAAVCVTIP